MDFDVLWAEYERELSAFVLSRVRDEEIQKEVMQELALKIFTSLHLQKEHLRGWLYTLTKNIIIDYYRKYHKLLPELEEAVEVEEHIMSECLLPMIDTLKDDEKEILSLTQLEQYSLKDISLQLNLPFNTVKSKLFRAKKSLANNFFTCCSYERNKQGDVVDFYKNNTFKC